MVNKECSTDKSEATPSDRDRKKRGPDRDRTRGEVARRRESVSSVRPGQLWILARRSHVCNRRLHTWRLHALHPPRRHSDQHYLVGHLHRLFGRKPRRPIGVAYVLRSPIWTD